MKSILSEKVVVSESILAIYNTMFFFICQKKKQNCCIELSVSRTFNTAALFFSRSFLLQKFLITPFSCTDW